MTVREALQDTPVVLIHGARQCGKTTLALAVGEPLGYHYISLDDDNQLQAAKADPVGFVQSLPELRKYADWHSEPLSFYHFRNKASNWQALKSRPPLP